MADLADLSATIIVPLLSLSGLLGGLLLSHLAKEEISSGKKYFIMLYRIIFVALSVGIAYFLTSPLIIVFLLCAIILLVLDIKMHRRYLFIIHYLFFLMGYFIAGAPVIIAAILFLYGLPVGTLLQVKEE